MISTRARARRGGFTLLEVTVVGFMTSLLASILATTCWSYYRNAAHVAARCQLAQEAELAFTRLARDLSGGFATHGRLVGIRQPQSGRIELCYDSLAEPDGIASWQAPDTAVAYQVAQDAQERNHLWRLDPSDPVEPELVAAHEVVSLDAFIVSGQWIQLNLRLRHPNRNLEKKGSDEWLERSYLLIARVF
jgi:type II secretory pathway pseudopilin PulG